MNWRDPIKGSAEGKVCTQYTGFLRMYDNVFHDNEVFGINVESIQPRLSSKESGGPWPSENATRYGQVAFVCAIAQKISVHGASMTNLTTYALEKRTLFKMKEMPPFSLGVYVK